MSPSKWLEKARLPETDGPVGTNEDLLPATEEKRTWTAWDFAATWSGPSFDINQWNTGSSFSAVGLTVPQTVAPVTIGAAIAAWAITAMGQYGARYGVGFPSLVRSTFGVGGSKAVVALRGVVGVIWYAVEAYYVAQMLKICFRCIFGYKWNDWAPAMPSDAGTTAQVLLAFFLTWLFIFPLCWVHPKNLKWWFVARSIIGPIVYLALAGWAIQLGRSTPGEFPGFSNLVAEPVKGSALAWAIISGINSVLATIAPQTTNVSDITRYARTTGAAGWFQALSFWATKVISVMLAIFSASYIKYRYSLDVAAWNAWDLLDLILDNEWSGATRFGVFIIAFGFGFSSTMTNTYANTVPFGADISALAPRYFNIIRGQILIAVLSPAVVPWKLFSTGAGFLTFLGSYTFFMAALTGPLLVDFYILKRANIHVPSLYNRDINSIYCFNSRVRSNWRGGAAFVAGVAVILPGLVEAYMPSKVGSPASRMYSTGWVISTAVSAVVFYGLNLLSPVPVLPKGNEELAASLKYNQMAETRGHLPEEQFQIDGVPVEDSDSEKKHEV